MSLRVLITHECSGEVRRAFRVLGHDAWSCDLKTQEDYDPKNPETHAHFQCDAVVAIKHGKPMMPPRLPWQLIIMHPVCQFLCGSGLHWNKRRPERRYETEAAVAHVRELVAACGSTPYALENPVGCLSTLWRKPDQIIQPYQFGDDASKKTCLWLQGLPKLVKDPARRVAGRLVEWPVGSGKIVERWANQTDSGQNKLTPSAHRAADRARTYPGIARAMSLQWGDYCDVV